LTGGVAHDFNNLLTIIRSSAELLRRTGHDETRRARYIKAIADTADRAALLTRQLLAFARQQPLQPEVFRVDTRIEAMTQMIETILGSTVGLELNFAHLLGQVEADASQFDTAILNMVVNAKDAMPAGGHLKISARNVDEAPAVRGHATAQGHFVAVAIEDTGSGIEPSALARIFEPFFTTKPPTKGTGLGLSQVYGFAKQSGGEISATSRLGEGTCFTLYLPRTTHTALMDAPDKAAQSLGATRNFSILFVEDNDEVGDFGVSLLTEMGHSAIRATHAGEALRFLQERHADFDLVFSDVVMPGKNGLEFAHEIRLAWPELPVILTSGYSHVLADEGSHGFELLQKPYSVQELQAIFERAVPAAKR
jgi:CheY-like chemotaxis protein